MLLQFMSTTNPNSRVDYDIDCLCSNNLCEMQQLCSIHVATRNVAVKAEQIWP